MNKKEFMELLAGITAARPNNPYDYCMKFEAIINKMDQEKLKCWKCEFAIFNDGMCDPL